MERVSHEEGEAERERIKDNDLITCLQPNDTNIIFMVGT
jgi:hypothetical protein